MKIIFMGTPDFAIPVLEALSKTHEIVAVVTAPDKPGGRGHALQQSAVKLFAQSVGLRVLQPKNLKSPVFKKKIQDLNADLFIVVAFRMLPSDLLNIPRFGSINLHASLLPKYRGAAPIQRAIMDGETRTGLTIFKLEREIDTGMILNQCSLDIGLDETGGELHDRMKLAGAGLMIQTLKKMEDGTIHVSKQDETMASYAPKIFREDGLIQWGHSVDSIYNQIRALIPYPCAWFEKNHIVYKIHRATKILSNHTHLPGSFIKESDHLWIACKGGYINVLEIQPEGRRKMKIKDFINGLNQVRSGI